MTPLTRLQRRPGQSGVTLIVALVFLLIITLLGISSMRGVALESRITGNLRQEKILTEAAEAGLRIGEKTVTDNTANPVAWALSELPITDSHDSPVRFTAEFANNISTVSTGYNTKIQWYVVQIGPLNPSMNNCGAMQCGPVYFEVNACASTVACTSDTTTRRVIMRSVIAHFLPLQ